MTPKLRFSEFKGEWKRFLLKDIVEIKAGGDLPPFWSKEKNDEFKFPIFSNSLENYGLYGYSKLPKITAKESVTVTGRGSVGIPVFRKGAYTPIVRLLTLIPKNSYVTDCKFLELAIQSIHIFIESTGVPQLTSPQIGAYRIVLTEYKEQQKIASLFCAVEQKINLLTKKKEALETYKKGLMQKIFSQELRFKREDGTDYPEWEVTYLGELCSITTGKLDANAQVEDGRYLFFTCAKEVFRIDEYAFEGASLLISGNGANVGYIHNYEGRFNAYQRTYVLQNIGVNRHYLQYYLEQNLQRRIHREKKDGNTPYIVMSTLSMMKIALPSEIEANKIARAMMTIDESLKQLTKKLNSTIEQKKGLLQQMFV